MTTSPDLNAAAIAAEHAERFPRGSLAAHLHNATAAPAAEETRQCVWCGWALVPGLAEEAENWRTASGGRYFCGGAPDALHEIFTPEVIAQDEYDHPHDDPCPRCQRRQWGMGPNVADPANPTDAEQETCGACGYVWDATDGETPAAIAELREQLASPTFAEQARAVRSGPAYSPHWPGEPTRPLGTGEDSLGAVMEYLADKDFEITGEITSDGGDIYDDTFSGTGTVRVVIYPQDGPRFELHAFDGHMVSLWSATFENVPASVLLYAIHQARAEVAPRGYPV